ncbi:hypothetical protein [Algoriphagus aquimarinus]|uniref:hypothetical protein n=1 Tax=Algoriphagus aquimarinus TaxID=237018 RepID=UPI0030DD9009
MNFENNRNIKLVTESSSSYEDLELMQIDVLLRNINYEDQKVALAVHKALPQIEGFIKILINRMKIGGKLFYIGAGTSGRLAEIDAFEIPVTYGVSSEMIQAILADTKSTDNIPYEDFEDD